MAPPVDLRAWIKLLEREGELVRVAAEVDPFGTERRTCMAFDPPSLDRRR